MVGSGASQLRRTLQEHRLARKTAYAYPATITGNNTFVAGNDLLQVANRAFVSRTLSSTEETQ